ncbi:CTP:molybdopterin cytidylyltransferase MocA [Marmoricola sp. URHA0025 HA25]
MTRGQTGSVAGVLLAAGAGIRYGIPKALVDGWLAGSVDTLREGGCDPVLVVLGAGAREARRLVPDGVDVVIAPDWTDGMGASLRAGLAAVATSGADAALVHLVDLPDVGPDVARRLTGLATTDVLARAVYDGRAGHPVLLGRAHWGPVAAEALGDEGARAYLQRHEVDGIECGDLAGGHDVDVPGP